MSSCSKVLFLFDFYGVLSSEIAPKWFSNHIKDEEEASILKKIKPYTYGFMIKYDSCN